MFASRNLAGFALLASPVLCHAYFVPTTYWAQAAYAGTNGPFNYLSSQDVPLGGSPFTLDETITAITADSSAATRRQVAIGSDQAWLRNTNSTSGRTSCGADGWLDFVVTDSVVRLDWDVAVVPLVWWDSAIVRVYDMTVSSLLTSKDSTSLGTMLINVTPGHTIRLYAAINQNNIYQGSPGTTAFRAEGTLKPVPEPATAFALGIGVLALYKRRK